MLCNRKHKAHTYPYILYLTYHQGCVYKAINIYTAAEGTTLGGGVYFTFCAKHISSINSYTSVFTVSSWLWAGKAPPPSPKIWFGTGLTYQHKHQCVYYWAQNALIKRANLSVLLLPTYTPLQMVTFLYCCVQGTELILKKLYTDTVHILQNFTTLLPTENVQPIL